MNAIRQLLGRKSRNPRLILSPPRAYFRNDDKPFPIGMERPIDDLIRDVRTIEVAGVDVIDTLSDSFSQHSNGAFHIPRRSPYMWTCKLHRAITNAIHCHRGARKA